ncbi:HD domain-containing protein [uncultured Sphaerochaeta sp.]|uniref:deoxyguanosinetriphosphate triphosphohydrolase family protein n=1 Tax=uncultured Sphaerochaeta sp. TaxID=886478 RepID=UPI002A0A60CF|nr:HD domain-containing protein [uncultured Sphaerochaeta sp.]
MELQNLLSESEMTSRLHERANDVRGSFYRDTTAIIHSSPFRRLKHKTQVFFAPSNDHICTRMEHCLHVASIASSICRGLSLDTELAWAIGMGHDLGHTPFGHTGEKILSGFLVQEGFAPFEHEVNSLRVVDFLSEHGKGLNLTYAVRDGIVSHNGERLMQTLKPDFTIKDFSKIRSRKNLVPSTYEGVVVRFSDSIAYLGRDFEDASRLNIVRKEQLPLIVTKRLGCTNGAIIDTLVSDVIENSNGDKGISFSDELFPAIQAMIQFNYEHIYKSPLLEGYERYFSRLLRLIVDYLKMLLDTYGFDEQRYASEKNMLAMGFFHHLVEMKDPYLEHDGSLDLLVYDYVAGMSDNFCLDCANEILKPEHLNDSIEHSLTGKWFDAR